MPQIITPDSHEHWLQLKSQDITSTEISALFGISPYSTLFEMWHQKKAGEVVNIESNERMLWGNRLEDAIAQGIAEDLDIKVRPLKTYHRHDSVKGMGSSFDYEIYDHPDGPGLFEIKNVDYLVYRDKWDDDEAPPHIESQHQHQLEVNDYNWGIIGCLVSGNTMNYIKRERNRAVGAAMRKKVEEFWISIVENKPPEPNFETDAAFVISLYGESNDWLIDVSDDEDMAQLIETFYDLNIKVKDLSELKEQTKAKILSTVQGGAKKITCGNFSISCGRTKDTPPMKITKDMIGDEVGGRQGYRMFRAFKKKPVKKGGGKKTVTDNTEKK